MSDLVPMKLSVRGRQIRHKKRKLEIKKIYKCHEVEGVKCSVVHNGREHILLLDVETPSSHIRFNLKTTTVVKLVGNFTHALAQARPTNCGASLSECMHISMIVHSY